MRGLAATAVTVACLAWLEGRGALAADAPGTTEVVVGVQAWLDGTQSLECRFEQRIVSGAMGAGTTERGRLRLLRPGKMRWDYDAPEEKVALVNGVSTLVYLPSDRQLIRGRLDAEGGALGLLLTGQARLDELFSAVLVAVPRKGGAQRFQLRLAPRAEAQALEAVLLSLRPSDFAIEAAEVVDPAGNVVEYRFESVRRNRGLRADCFQFEPPPGTEIVETGAP